MAVAEMERGSLSRRTGLTPESDREERLGWGEGTTPVGPVAEARSRMAGRSAHHVAARPLSGGGDDVAASVGARSEPGLMCSLGTRIAVAVFFFIFFWGGEQPHVGPHDTGMRPGRRPGSDRVGWVCV